jgi:hypothetical protein
MLLLLLALLSSTGTLCAAPEVRMLIDVSGSMRQNDPRNLRVPALRLVNELLPKGAKAGVWLFAEKVDTLAPPGQVDDQWKTRTRTRLERIHSRGLFTDIEQAITAGIAGWDEPTGDSDRHLVLLTDGLVDVSTEADKSVASRERIIATQLARLKALKVKVHAIALSDAVDTDLLRLLADQTGGWLESAQDADALQRIFLHMLEQTAAPTTVPLEGNRFEIDPQVSEFTLLAFRGAEKSTSLVAPDGKTISSTQPREGTIWREEEGYDLVTLSKPTPGQWQLNGMSDPDNRVVVVTDLGIELGPLPNVLHHGERLHIETWLTDHQQPVTRDDLLQLVIAKASLTALEVSVPPLANHAQPVATEASNAPAAGEHAQPSHDATAAHPHDTGSSAPAQETQKSQQPVETSLLLDQGSGRYRADLETGALDRGIYQLQVTLDSGTFKRQSVKRIRIGGSPLTIRYAQQNPSDKTPAAALIATLDAEPGLIDPRSLSGYLLMQGSEGQTSVSEVTQPAALPLILAIPVEKPGDYRIQGRLIARTLSGETIDFAPEPKQLVFAFATPAPAAEATHDSAAQTLSWVELGVYLLIGNAILGLMLGLTWWLLHRSVKSRVAEKIKQSIANPA